MSNSMGINSILFIADSAPDERYALRRAVEMAVRWQARLVVMDVIELSSVESSALRRASPSQGLLERLITAREEELQAMVASHNAAGIDIRVKVASGRLHHNVLRAINRSGHRMLVKGAKGPSQAPHAIGPMDLRLIRLSPCPVMILRERPPGPVVTALSLEKTSVSEAGDRLMLRLAQGFAEMSAQPLHLVHAWELPDKRILRAVNRDEGERLHREIEGEHRALLERFVASYAPFPLTSHLREGWSSHVVPELVGALGAELLVLGGPTAMPQEHPHLGSILEVIIHQVQCSLLVVKS